LPASRKRAMEKTQPIWPPSDCLGIEVTTDCNRSCSHCFVRARPTRGASLSPHLVRAIIREGYEAGYRHLHVTGGEPLLWNGLPSIFDYAFSLGYKTGFLNTNGTLLTGKVARDLEAYGGLSISVSLQGPKGLHDNIRGRDSYGRALRGIENALAAGVPVYIFTTVGRGLVSYLPRFAEGLFMDFPDIQQLTLIQLIRVPGDVFDLSKEVLTPEDFLRVVRTVSFLNTYGMRVGLLNNPLAGVACRLLGMPAIPPSAPLYRQGSVLITAERRITLAHSTTDDFGTYGPGMLLTIGSSPDYCRAVSPDRSLCTPCDYYSLCIIEGMDRPSEWYRDMNAEVPYCRRVLARASSYG